MTDLLAEPRIRIDDRLNGSAGGDIAAEVREGLTKAPLKELPPKLFYDARGSELFDRITQLPEYYPTRCERSILNRRAPEIVEIAGAEELIELGSGSASKTRALLFAMAGAGALRRYVPVDVSAAPVERCADELSELYPGIEVHGLIGDFNHYAPTTAQQQRLTQLVRALQQRFNIAHQQVFMYPGKTEAVGVGSYFPNRESRSQFLP